MNFNKIKKVVKETFKMVSDKFKDNLESTDEEMIDITQNNYDSEQDDFSMDNDTLGQTQRFDMKDALSRFKKRADDLGESISDIFHTSEAEDMDKISGELSELSKSIGDMSRTTNTELKSIMTAVCGIDKKLSELTASLSGVNKLNDSIFDLKNSQMNTKNSLGDLELSFRRLKKKMTAGIVIISIISAVIAVLKVINLLS